MNSHDRSTRPGLIVTLLLTVLCGMAAPTAVAAQRPLTRAERTDYLETSRYEDVLAFLDALPADPAMHRTHFGYSYLGRRLPLVVVGDGLESASPEEVMASGRTRVLVFANIHGGEVEGKEAAQMLLRAFAAGEHDRWLDSLVVLVAPIYNVDGNDAISVTNRFRQHGPLSGVGERENVQGLDLNRDHMKLESPEARSLVGLMNRYDPHVVVDLHTTNGTTHAYHLTYSPPLHPNTDPRIVSFLREEWLPEVTREMRDEHGWNAYYYGNAYAPDGMEEGWYTFDYRPRFNNNYVGLRNRFAILSEAYSYVEFEDRVDATLGFVEEILEFAHANASDIRDITRAADRADLPGQRLATRATFNRDGEVEILMGDVEDRLNRFSGRRYLARQDVVEPERMAEYGTFRPTATERVPSAYYVPPHLGRVVDLLALHGVETERLESAVTRRVERFVIESTELADREFQGHRERDVAGRWVPAEVTLPEGTVVVPMRDQALARVVFTLLEPGADDGVLNWNVLDEELEEQPDEYPIYRSAEGGAR